MEPLKSIKLEHKKKQRNKLCSCLRTETVIKLLLVLYIIKKLSKNQV